MATWDEMKYYYPILRGRQKRDFIQHENGGWIENTANVTRSIINNGCLVLDKAKVDMCELKGQSVIKDNAKVTWSSLDYISMIGGNAKVDRCRLSGSNILDNAIVRGSVIRTHSTVQDNANINNSTLDGKSRIVGTSTLSICHIYNATVNILKKAFLTEFADGSFTDIPLVINDQLIGYNINVYKEKVAVRCTQQSIDWWEENARKVWKANFSCIKEKDIDKVVKVLTTLQEVYNDNLG